MSEYILVEIVVRKNILLEMARCAPMPADPFEGGSVPVGFTMLSHVPGLNFYQRRCKEGDGVCGPSITLELEFEWQCRLQGKIHELGIGTE